MDSKKFVICSLVVGLLFAVLDMVIAMITMPLYAAYSDLPIWNNPPNVFAGMIFDLINGFILVGVYHIIKEGIPYEGLKKGAIYGIIVGLFRVIMMTFSTIVMYNVPIDFLIVSTILGFIEVIILGILVVILYEKLEVE